MKYQVIGTLKVRTPSGVRELRSGETVTLPGDMAFRLVESGRVKPFSPDCFSPDGTLEEALMETKADGWTDEQLCIYIDALWETGVLRAPWGFKVLDSPLVGDFWIISDTTARDELPVGAKSFTIEELRPLIEVFHVFEGSTVMEVRFPMSRVPLRV
ncbi:MAG: hypothetical protein K8I01_10720 [Candidatus Methylomirabilis sp.]|nr:hypothetical protein [Deltaproteobacteria bacterium]